MNQAYRRQTYVPYPSSIISKFQKKSLSLLATSVRTSFPYIDSDRLDPSAPRDAPQDGCTDPVQVTNAFLTHVTNLLSRISTILGDPDGSAAYATSASALRLAFNKEYHPGTSRSKEQTPCRSRTKVKIQGRISFCGHPVHRVDSRHNR